MDKPTSTHRGPLPRSRSTQKTASRNPPHRGTITEIHDYLRLLFARVASQHFRTAARSSPVRRPNRPSPVLARTKDRTVLGLATVVEGRKGEYSTLLSELAAQGFSRARVDGVVIELAEREVRWTLRVRSTRSTVVLRPLEREDSDARSADLEAEGLKLTRGLVSFLSSIKTSSSSSPRRWRAMTAGWISGTGPRDFSFNSPTAPVRCARDWAPDRGRPDLVVPTTRSRWARARSPRGPGLASSTSQDYRRDPRS